jgi:hypothetical protein
MSQRPPRPAADRPQHRLVGVVLPQRGVALSMTSIDAAAMTGGCIGLIQHRSVSVPREVRIDLLAEAGPATASLTTS